MKIQAFNLTHYAFSAGPAFAPSNMQTLGYGLALGLSYSFTGTSPFAHWKDLKLTDGL